MPKDLKKKRWFEQNIQAGLFADLDKSPMPAEDDPLPAKGARLPDPFPPADWAGNMAAYARGDKSSKMFPSAEETQVKADRGKLDEALATTDLDERAVNMAKELNAQLGSQFRGKVVKRAKGDKQHPGEARLQRAHLSLEALLAAGKDFAAPADRKVLLRAIDALPPEQQKDLLRADEATGRRLYSALYQASKEDPELKDSFAQVKGAAQLARIGSKLDKHDPSGETDALVNGVMRHLDQAGLSDQEQNAFVEKLAFKMTISGPQGDHPDMPLPDTSKPGWREKFTARTLSLVAETPSVSDESIEKALDIPEADLVKVLGNVYVGPIDQDPRNNPDQERREGDMRLARVARAQAAKKGDKDLHALLEGLESNYLDRRRMLALAQEGKPVKEILETLEAEAAEDAGKAATQVSDKIADRLKRSRARKLELEEEIRKIRAGGKEPAKPLSNELRTLNEAIAILDKVKPPSKEQALKLMQRFGRYPIAKIMGNTGDWKAYAQGLRQVQIQVAAIEVPNFLLLGLKMCSYVLPSGGMPLNHCPWLQTTSEDLVRIATEIRKVEEDFTLVKYPIIVLDQSDGNGRDPAKTKLWKDNDTFLKKLEADHGDVGLTIKHISLANINGLIKDSGVEKMFDTTGEGNAGYGGCRNMAFFLGPVIQDAVRKGEDPSTIAPDTLAKRIKDTALNNAPKLFMGDDTDYVAPGGVASKAALAGSDEHGDEYSLIATNRFGRDTQGVGSMYANVAVDRLESGGLEAFTAHLFSSNKWNTKNTVPGMGCTFGEPRFCLDLPTGAEEKQCENSTFMVDHFGQSSHLSGDRQAPTSSFLKSYMAYGNMTVMVKTLLDESQLPWNTEGKKRKSDGTKPFDNLGEVMGEAVDPAKRKEMQKKMLTRLVGWRGKEPQAEGPLQLDGNQGEKVQEYLDGHPELDGETRDELTKIKGVYDDGKRQAKLMKTFMDRLLLELALPAKGTPEEVERAANTALADPASVQKAITKVRNKMVEEGSEFNAGNSMLRDLALVLESVGGGGFSDLSAKLVNAA